MLGQKLIAGLAKIGSLSGKKIESITVVDAYNQSRVLEGFDFTITSKIVDITEDKECQAMIADKPDVIFHLAAIVSGEAEADFEKGYRINLDGTRYLFEAIRKGDIPGYLAANHAFHFALYDAADEARLPDPVIHQLTQIFSNQIDFHRTLRKGARFSVVYEVLEADGEPLRTGRVLSAEFHNDNQQYDAVWFQEPGQKGNYYDMDGKSLSRSYLASPLTFSRQSSGFAMRLHPIFNTMQAHRGVDYAAPTGTPAMTVGDGVVTFAGRQGGYGNVVEIRHGNGHSTLYAHLSRIQVRTGQTVQKGQVIGAVGSTGWSTGPHLHFEFRVNGVHVDPRKIIQQAQSGPIAPASKASFVALVRQAQSQLQAAAQMREVNSQ